MATHSSILAWKIPRTGKPGWLQSMGYKESDTSESLHMQGSSEELCKARDFIRRREQEQGSCTKQKKKKERKKGLVTARLLSFCGMARICQGDYLTR